MKIRIAGETSLYFGTALVTLLLFSCGKQTPDAQPGPQKDYAEMIDRVKTRRASKQSVLDIQQAVRDFQMRHGRMPKDLAELIRFGSLDGTPDAPEGYYFTYDPQLGNVGIRAIPKTQTFGADL